MGGAVAPSVNHSQTAQVGGPKFVWNTLSLCFGLLFVSVIRTKSSLRKIGLISCYRWQSITEGDLSKSWRQEPEAETTGGCCSLPSLSLTFSCFSYTTRTTCPGVAMAILPRLLTRDMSHRLAYRPKLRFPFYGWFSLVRVKLKKPNHHRFRFTLLTKFSKIHGMIELEWLHGNGIVGGGLFLVCVCTCMCMCACSHVSFSVCLSVCTCMSTGVHQ